ncbi:MAG: 3-dehydroquinate synthase [Acidiferrobacterales bacterium]
MKMLNVELGERSYPIYIGSNLLLDKNLLAQHITGSRVAIVSNETVAPLYLSAVENMLSDFNCTSIVLPDGEKYKNLENLNRIFDKLLETRCDRQTTLIALGGGVIGDMTGFAAASYQRGVPFIQIPTTLLAQVDSSVGGKTGVNHALGKNMIGAFYQPKCVLIDTNTLQSLPDNELSAGLAEVIKYGLIRDLEFFDWLEQNMDKILERDGEALAYAIERSCWNKAEIVANDEREAGQRALLNFGHTFGHAIETGSGYGSWFHGEAVAAGMVMAVDMSQRMGWLSNKDVDRVTDILTRARLPVSGPDALAIDRYLELMAVDKKVQDGRMRLVLLKKLGNAFLCDSFDHDKLRQTLAMCRSNNTHANCRTRK